MSVGRRLPNVHFDKDDDELLMHKTLYNITRRQVPPLPMPAGAHDRSCAFYTLNHKKRDILFFTITLATFNRFLYFLYHLNREETLYDTVVKFTA